MFLCSVPLQWPYGPEPCFRWNVWHSKSPVRTLDRLDSTPHAPVKCITTHQQAAEALLKALGHQQIMQCCAHLPSTRFLNQYVPFLDQYKLSLQLWSPDSTAFCFPAFELTANAGQFLILRPE
eukprot:jgi/Chrzof1/898/Cz01g32330.t1